MQTFLPYPSFKQSARCLDTRRLNKQIQECIQILKILEGESQTRGWRNHPAVLQWVGYEESLKCYLNCCIDEWLVRKGKNGEYFNSNKNKYRNINYSKYQIPWWIGNNKFHSSHRSNLLRKDFKWYSQFNWLEDQNKPYLWPSKVKENI